jgi:hypothetical protein
MTDGLIRMSSSLIIWSIYFVSMYALVSLGCSYGIPHADFFGINALQWVLVAVTSVTLASTAYIGARRWHYWRHTDQTQGSASADKAVPPFLARTALLVCVVALIATMWVAIPVFLLPTCT